MDKQSNKIKGETNMSKIIKKDKHEIIAEQELIKTLNKLAGEASKSVDTYIENAPVLQNITELILEVLKDPNEINSLEHKDLLKLFEIATKFQMQPLEQFTKLFAQMSQFQEKLNVNKELDKLRGLTDEFNRAKTEADLVEVEETGYEGLIVDVEDDEDIEEQSAKNNDLLTALLKK